MVSRKILCWFARLNYKFLSVERAGRVPLNVPLQGHGKCGQFRARPNSGPHKGTQGRIPCRAAPAATLQPGRC